MTHKFSVGDFVTRDGFDSSAPRSYQERVLVCADEEEKYLEQTENQPVEKDIRRLQRYLSEADYGAQGDDVASE